jgi:hypothetical protein
MHHAGGTERRQAGLVTTLVPSDAFEIIAADDKRQTRLLMHVRGHRAERMVPAEAYIVFGQHVSNAR